MQVADIMTKEVITVGLETPLKEAAGILAKFRVHGLPVVDAEKKVLGIVAESDFFTKDASNIFLPTFLEFARGRETGEAEKADLAEAGQKTKIKDIMTADCFTVKPNLSIEELIQYIKDKNFNSIPVVDDQGVLVGIVSIMDIIRLF